MNYLFHLLLSGDDDELLVGNFMGDFIKGPVGDGYPLRVRQGIMLHRRIDSYAARDEDFRRSRLRLDPGYGHYRGVLVDLFYDHLLLTSWRHWCPLPLHDYLAAARQVVDDHEELLPPAARRLVPLIFDEFIPLYATIDGVGQALARMSRRVTRQNPLTGSEGELAAHYPALMEDFQSFTPRLQRFAADFALSAGGGG
jgi:acyl carrier protein phosphodiesterase